MIGPLRPGESEEGVSRYADLYRRAATRAVVGHPELVAGWPSYVDLDRYIAGVLVDRPGARCGGELAVARYDRGVVTSDEGWWRAWQRQVGVALYRLDRP